MYYYDPNRPPAQIKRLYDAVGEETTVRFLMMFGGAELFLTQNMQGGSQLEREFGRETALKIAGAFGYTPQRIPLVKPWIAAVMEKNGLSTAQIARMLHVSDWAVRRWRKTGGPAHPPDPRQSSLL